jgi:hypothetical protein
MRRFRPSHATVVAYVALFVALGGTAMAAVVITSNSQVAKGTISGHHPPSGKHANIIAGSVNGKDVAANSLTGADIKQPTLTKLDDNCHFRGALLGRLCADSDGVVRPFLGAMSHCADNGLRLPDTGEAYLLAKNHDVPGVDTGEYFWTSDNAAASNVASNIAVAVVDEGADVTFAYSDTNRETVCVETPTDVP